jgi:NADH pyrophosphatase NudC (nudix superfamily)
MQNNTTPTSGPVLRDSWNDPIAALGTGFTGNPLDRCSERRDDLAFVEGLRRDPRARLLLFAADVPLVLIPAAATALPRTGDAGASSATPPPTDLTIPLERRVGVSLNTIVSAGVDSVGIPYVLHETLVRALAGAGFGAGARDHANADEESVLLGIDADGVPWFAERVDVAPDLPQATCPDMLLAWPDTDAAAEVQGASPVVVTQAAQENTGGTGITGIVHLRAVGLRVLAAQGQATPGELAMLAQAKAVLDWHVRHRFCARCGTASRVAAAGWRRECPACAAVHFPRVDPVVIMIVIDVDGPRGPRCLLGRQPQFAAGMYSALAGFLEPGEAVEDAVRREVLEEAGIRCGPVRYVASQPWPFPGSLMLGCAARATSTTLQIDKNELEDARWFDRDEVRQMMDGNHPEQLKLPQPHAIASTLIRAFADGLLD